MNRLHRSSDRSQRGFTLVELLVALVLGALVVLAATAMVVTSRATYRTQDEATRVQETSRFGLELVNRMVRLAGYTDFGDSTLPPPAYTADGTWDGSNAFLLNGPNLVGADHAKPSGTAINGSDALVIRYYGSGNSGAGGDGSVLDCAGFPVPAPAASVATYSTSRAYNVLYVDLDPDNEPSLKCQRQLYDAAGNPLGTFDTQTLLRGVESLQILYGEANFSGGDPDLVAPTSIVYRTGIGGANPVVNWSNVVTVRIAMLIRSNVGAQVDNGAQNYYLFGAPPAATYPNYGTDTGAQMPIGTWSAIERTRIRRVVETTVFVRNRISQWPALN